MCVCAVRDEEITSSFICDLIVGAHLHCHKEHFTVFIIEQHWTPIHRGLMVNHVIITWDLTQWRSRWSERLLVWRGLSRPRDTLQHCDPVCVWGVCVCVCVCVWCVSSEVCEGVKVCSRC